MTLDNPAVKTSPDILGPSFSIVSKEITIEPAGADGRRRFHLTASSTIEDMAGDEIEVPALHKAATKFQNGVTIFMDHDYRHVESAFGVTDHAEVVQKGIDEKTGKPVYDLDIHGVVNTPNPRASQLADSIDGGYVKLGASLTAFIRKHARKPNGGMLIKDMDVVEASVVGVAENQRSWAHKAALAVKSFHKPEWLIEDEETVVTKDASIDEGHSTDEEAPVAETAAAETVEATETVELAAQPETAEAASVCPECGQSADTTGCDNGFHAAATEAVAESDTGGQESASETPETAPTADETETEPAEQKAASFNGEDVAELVHKSAQMVVEIEHLRTENARLEGELSAERRANSVVSKEVDLATEIIEKVMKQPLRSRTAGFVADFHKSSSLFDPDIAEYLEKRERTTPK